MARVERVVCPYDGPSGTPSPTPVIRVCSPVLSQMAIPHRPAASRFTSSSLGSARMVL